MGRSVDNRAQRTGVAVDTDKSGGIEWDSPEVSARLREAGLRPTAARCSILALLAGLRVHPTVDELAGFLRTHDREVRPATLYQSLARLAETGVIASFVDADGLMRFDASIDSHPHLVCTRCGAIADVEPTPAQAKRLQGLASGFAHEHSGWQLAETRLELRALCPACSSGP